MQIFIQDLSNLFNMHLLLFFKFLCETQVTFLFFEHSGILMPSVCGVGVKQCGSHRETFLPDIVFYGRSCDGFGSLV